MKAKIESVRIERVVDTNPDSSYLGKYTDKISDYAIVRIGEYYGKFVKDLPENAEIPPEERKFRFFLSAYHVPHNSENWSHVQGEELAKIIAKYGSLEKADEFYAKEDFRRLESLNDGQWCYLGIIAKAEIISRSGICQTLRSGGLWGIESDSGKDYFEEIEKKELAELRTELESFGFGSRAIDFSFKNIEYQNDV